MNPNADLESRLQDYLLDIISNDLLRRKAKIIKANFQTGNKAIILCKLNNVAQNCCLDTGAQNSLMSLETFSAMNIFDKLYTRQTFNLLTATTLERDAIQGTVVLDLLIHNQDKTTQVIRQKSQDCAQLRQLFIAFYA